MSRLGSLLFAAAAGRRLLQQENGNATAIPLGSTTALAAEASDAGSNADLIADGQSGDTDFPHGALKPIFTVGETDPVSGTTITGVPDGMGAYLLDEDTVRIIVQSESYGPISQFETYPFTANGGVTFSGSHVHFVDVDRAMLASFMSSDKPASDMIKEAGNLIETVYNANGEMVVPRNADGPTPSGAFDSAVDVDGNYVLVAEPSEADWHFQSLCSAMMAPKHQWGPNMGFVDNVYLTVEEWTDYNPNSTTGFIGLPMHAVDVKNKVSHAVGATGFGGFEKVVEMSCGDGNDAFVCLAIVGYNGAFGDVDAASTRNEMIGPRQDGSEWVNPANVVPARVYVGVKGLDTSGVPADDFLSRNGLNYGKVYGFAVPEDTPVRDEAHKVAAKGDKVTGAFLPVDWMWSGAVDDFQTDYAWEFQEPPVADPTMRYWNALGPEEGGKKMEHNSPDPRGNTRFIQGSTAGYMGIYELDFGALSTLADGGGAGTASESKAAAAAPVPAGSTTALPASISAVYTVVQPETSIVDQIELGGKGVTADGGNQTVMNDGDSVHETFEDIDGLYWFAASDGDYLIIQEDGGNIFGERMFISKLTDGTEPLVYHFIAQAGGEANTRSLAGVGVPAGVFTEAKSAEFSGAIDLSPFLYKEDGEYVLPAGDETGVVRTAAEQVAIDDKVLALGLQMHSYSSGVISELGADRGGQVYAYQPSITEA